MDVFVEQLFKRENKPIEKFIKIALFAVCGLMAGFSVLFFMSFMGGRLLPFSVLVAAGLLYLSYFVGGQLNIEFEYILTNGTFDVDAIVNMRKRRRLVSFECKNLESFAKYDPNHNYHCSGVIFAANANSENLYCMTVNTKEKGKALLVIEPNEKMLDGLKKCMPRQLWMNVL